MLEAIWTTTKLSSKVNVGKEHTHDSILHDSIMSMHIIIFFLLFYLLIVQFFKLNRPLPEGRGLLTLTCTMCHNIVELTY